jgi:hypothetical protein
VVNSAWAKADDDNDWISMSDFMRAVSRAVG